MILLPLFFLLVGCGGGEESTETTGANPTARDAACIGADSSIMTPLGNKLRVENGRVRSGYLVKTDGANVVYLSAEIDGNGLEEEGDIGTWVTESRHGADPLYTVNEVARKNSDWSDAASSGLELDPAAEQASRNCVTGS